MDLDNTRETAHQNLWESKNERQRRRAELIKSLVRKHKVKWILDIGCAEGFITKYLYEAADRTIGTDSDLQYLKTAKKELHGLDFVNASIEFSPFRDSSFDGITILEVLEHLPASMQEHGLQESQRLLKKNGLLIVSVPYKENIIKTKCIHCGKITPLYGHLHVMDETYIQSKFGKNSSLVLRSVYRLPNIQMISCKSFFKSLPFRLWLILNDILGLIKKGYWAVYCFSKE
jgi:2-polyprenyl-3-methyl-5-hydroxy-6-metoxy-1,4-benzoquinol methylase